MATTRSGPSTRSRTPVAAAPADGQATRAKPKAVRIDYSVLLYVPQLIGWLRVAMMVTAVTNRSNPCLVCGAYLASLTLDMVDGAAARALGQTSRFGEVLDVTIDCGSRTFLWVLVATEDSNFAQLSSFLISMDWLTFVCAQASERERAIRALRDDQRTVPPMIH